MERPTRFDHQAKVICIGNSGVGKSSLVLRFCDDEWSPSYISTVGVDFKCRIVNVDGYRIRFLLWDTAGQDRFRTITRAFYRGSEGVLLVYDVSNYSSFEEINKWADDVSEAGVPEWVPKLLVGNKSDRPNRAVSTEQGQKLAETLGAQFCETSAKYSDGVIAAFMMLASDIKKRRMETDPNLRLAGSSGEARPTLGPTDKTKTIIVSEPPSGSLFGGCAC